MPHDVVISYSRRNRDIADRFAGLLRERGLDVWYDRMIRTGADWRDEIARAIADSRSFVILFSASSNDSEELKKEYSIAERRDLVIVPIRIDNVEPSGFFEYELSRRQWFDAFTDRDAQLVEAADQLLEALRPGAHRANPAPPKPAELNRESPPAPPASSKLPAAHSSKWIWLTLAVLNTVLGLLAPYAIVWPAAFAAFVYAIASTRPTPAPVKWYSIAQIAGAAIAGITAWLRSDGLAAAIAALTLMLGGLILAGYLAYESFGRKKQYAFWITPVLGGAIFAFTYYAVAGLGFRVDGVTLGMTVANAAFLYDAVKRFQAAKP